MRAILMILVAVFAAGCTAAQQASPSPTATATTSPPPSPSPGLDCAATPADASPSPAADLTGVWRGDDDGIYYLRQTGNCLWWFGRARGAPTEAEFANVFVGTISGSDIDGDWADVPYGEADNAGTLTLTVEDENRIRRTAETGGFDASEWRRVRDTDETTAPTRRPSPSPTSTPTETPEATPTPSPTASPS